MTTTIECTACRHELHELCVGCECPCERESTMTDNPYFPIEIPDEDPDAEPADPAVPVFRPNSARREAERRERAQLEHDMRRALDGLHVATEKTRHARTWLWISACLLLAVAGVNIGILIEHVGP